MLNLTSYQIDTLQRLSTPHSDIFETPFDKLSLSRQRAYITATKDAYNFGLFTLDKLAHSTVSEISVIILNHLAKELDIL